METAETSTWEKDEAKKAMNGVYVAGASILLLFVAFNPAQNALTSRDKNVGSISLSIVYGCFTIATAFAPTLLHAVQTRKVLIVASIPYVFFVAANIMFWPITLYCASALVGVAAAAIWTGIGQYILTCALHYERVLGLKAGSVRGDFNGRFMCIFTGNSFIGSLLIALLYLGGMSTVFVFSVVTIIGGVGSYIDFDVELSSDETLLSCTQIPEDSIFVQLSKLPKEQPARNEVVSVELVPFSSESPANAPREDVDSITLEKSTSKEDGENPSMVTLDLPMKAKDSLAEPSKAKGGSLAPPASLLATAFAFTWSTVKQGFTERPIRLMLPYAFYVGVVEAVCYGVLPAMLEDNVWRFFTLAVFGLASSVSSLLMGRWSDRGGRFASMVVGFAMVSFSTVIIALDARGLLGEYALTNTTNDPDFKQITILRLAVFFLLAILLGAGLTTAYTKTYALSGIFVGTNPAVFVANMKMHMSLASCILYFLFTIVPLDHRALLLLVCGVIAHYCIVRLKKTHPIESNNTTSG